MSFSIVSPTPPLPLSLLCSHSLLLHIPETEIVTEPRICCSEKAGCPGRPPVYSSLSPSAGVIGTYNLAFIFTWVLCIPSQVLMLVQQVIYSFSHILSHSNTLTSVFGFSTSSTRFAPSPIYFRCCYKWFYFYQFHFWLFIIGFRNFVDMFLESYCSANIIHSIFLFS